MSHYHLRSVILQSGERLPFLLTDAGVPLHGPMVFAVAEVRNSCRAANTVANTLGALSVFQRFLDDLAINLLDRLESGRLLELGEIENLVRFCRTNFSGRKPTNACVTAAVCAARLRTVRNYLEWLVKGRALATAYPHSAVLEQRYDFTVRSIDARIPPASDPIDPREGLAPEVVARATEVLRPDSQENPWRTEYARVRNDLIFTLLNHLGERAGELLGLRIRNIDLRKGTLTIIRQPDCPDDPRRRQPNTKTLARTLDISAPLQRRISEYILVHRRKLKHSHSHDFLLVAASGKPLSYSALNKVFRDLRTRHPELSQNLTPHVLRHTWNDRFSEEMDAHKIDAEAEKRIRSYLMGWKPGSGAAAVYTRRSVRNKARQLSIELQTKLMEGK